MDTDTALAILPDCAFPRCPRKACVRLASRYCWPHTPARRRLFEDTEDGPRLLVADIDADELQDRSDAKAPKARRFQKS